MPYTSMGKVISYSDSAGTLNFSCRMSALSFLILLLLLVISGCERTSPPEKTPGDAKPAALHPANAKPAGVTLKETRLAVMPDNYERWSHISFSANGQKVFYRAGKRNEELMVSGNAPGKSYDSVMWIVFSSDGQKVAYGGRSGKRSHLVVDGEEVKRYGYEVAPSNFSPDGRFIAAEVEENRREWFIIASDGVKEIYRRYAYPRTLRPPVFSPNSRLLAYELGDGEKNRTVVIVDLITGKIIKEKLYSDVDFIGKYLFSSDSSRVIYGSRKKDKIFVVLHDLLLNEERWIESPYGGTGIFALSPDGNRVFYDAIKEGAHFLVINTWEARERGKEIGPYNGIGQIFFSPDVREYAYNAFKGGKWRLVVGDREGPEYHSLGDVSVFSPDGAHIAYAAMKNEKWIMAVSPVGTPAAVKEGPTYDMVVTPVFSPDSRYIAYRARTGSMENARRFIVIADAATGKVIKEGRVGDEILPPVWSSDGKTVGYGAKAGRELWWRVETVK